MVLKAALAVVFRSARVNLIVMALRSALRFLSTGACADLMKMPTFNPLQ
jgi:hypothetical protein